MTISKPEFSFRSMTISLVVLCIIMAVFFIFKLNFIGFISYLFVLITGIILGAAALWYLNSRHILFSNAPTKKIKIGFDIHGCIDYDPKFFSELTKSLVESHHEVHIMTGSEITPAIVAELKGYGIMWTHLFSISDYYKNMKDVELWRDDQGRPWVTDDLWNVAKSQYAKEESLDLVIDDTAVYGEYFTTTSFAHCSIINKSGKVRLPKAVMPVSPTEKKRLSQVDN